MENQIEEVYGVSLQSQEKEISELCYKCGKLSSGFLKTNEYGRLACCTEEICDYEKRCILNVSVIPSKNNARLHLRVLETYKNIVNQKNHRGFQFRCPVCKEWIPHTNIAGKCPHCGAYGYKDKRGKECALSGV